MNLPNTFEEKMKHLIAEIANFLGEPDHMR